MNLLSFKKQMKDVETTLRKLEPSKTKPVCIINCESWRIIGPAKESDNRKAKARIIKRIRNAFWL